MRSDFKEHLRPEELAQIVFRYINQSENEIPKHRIFKGVDLEKIFEYFASMGVSREDVSESINILFNSAKIYEPSLGWVRVI